MGNIIINKMTPSLSSKQIISPKQAEPEETFKFLDFFPEEDNNGLYLNDVYFPEEMIMIILSYLDPKEILRMSDICKKWFNLTRTDSLWTIIYHRRYHKKAKKLPWYVYYCLFSTNYFDRNLIKNGNGQEEYKYWKTLHPFSIYEFEIEDPPDGIDPLPPNVPEFNGYTSCFTIPLGEISKWQEINLENNKLMQLILDKYKPHIYVSEWVAGRFDNGCVYKLLCKLYGVKAETKIKPKELRRNSSSNSEHKEEIYDLKSITFNENLRKKWSKVEFVVKKYPCGVKRIIFQHKGCYNVQFWDHCTNKMAGGVLKILFDTIEPLP